MRASPVRAESGFRKGVATPTAILDAAERIFAKHGLHGARTEAIAASVGITKAMINYHFGSKENLYVAVLERVYRERAEGLDLEALERIAPLEALRRFVESLLEQLARKPHVGSLFALENLQNQGHYFGKNGTATSFLAGILERGVEQGVFRRLDPRHTAINIMGSCIHYFNVIDNMQVLWRNDGAAEGHMSEHAASALEFIMAGVCAREGRRAK